MRFYLGVPKLSFAAQAGVPTFIPFHIIEAARRLPELPAEAAIDPNGFTTLQFFGSFFEGEHSGAYEGPRPRPPTPLEYVRGLVRAEKAMKRLVWASCQDWMCEPAVIGGLVEELKKDQKPTRINVRRWLEWARGKGSGLASAVARAESLGARANVVFHGTGLDVPTHQARTVANFIELRRLAIQEGLQTPIIPVLQGWSLDDYLQCWRLYEESGVDLRREPVVGVGSVCRRQGTKEAGEIFVRLAKAGLRGRMHGFGVKFDGLAYHIDTSDFTYSGDEIVADLMGSADAQAEAYRARKQKILLPGHDEPGPGRPRGHKNCANCLPYLLKRRVEMLANIEAKRPPQRSLWGRS